MSQLRVTSPSLSGKIFELSGDYFTIGREPDNTIHLDHTSVSKRHAMLKIDNGDFKLFDLHSTNGIIINGEQQVVAHLREGDKILLGEVELRFEPDSKDATQRLALPMALKQEIKPTPPAQTVITEPLKPVAPPSPPIPAPEVVPTKTEFKLPPPPKVEPKLAPPPAPAAPVQPSAADVKPVAQSPPTPKEPPIEKPSPPKEPAAPAAGKIPSKVSSLFRRHREPDQAPPPPPSRDEIHAGLTETFGKLGLELPKPPPTGGGKTSESTPVSLPPPPKTTRPKPPEPPAKAKREVLPLGPDSERGRGGLRELGVKLSWAMGRFLPERIPPQPPLPPPQEKPTTEPQPREQQLQVKPAPAVVEIELKSAAPSPVTTITLEPPTPAMDRLLRTPVSAPTPAIETPMVVDQRGSRRRGMWVVMFFAGVLVLGLGYLLDLGMLKFVGLIAGLTGLFSLIFSMKFGSLIAPPKRRPIV